MSICANAGGARRAGGWIVRLLAIAFALRSLVPVGFMPDVAAAQDGNFRVIICTVHGMVAVEVDETGKIVPGKTDAKTGQQCTFSVLGTLLLPTLDGGVILSVRRVIAAELPMLAVDLPPVRAGPQLGSRGPPTIS
ncbi:hypothetical protein DLM45_04125 [Hyphomicrobium methylovorum]|uniref:DUF2946 family protein n=1 Tax=Hyphomicrobium methylovorum TaxID=84 RepID=UPI0015E74181|nr:DUF2946 family protein [Hyphomicrobium methylovorum]MBA2125410.1 hypothetical protein [Hyphomicrobium methylovorum]